MRPKATAVPLVVLAIAAIVLSSAMTPTRAQEPREESELRFYDATTWPALGDEAVTSFSLKKHAKALGVSLKKPFYSSDRVSWDWANDRASGEIDVSIRRTPGEACQAVADSLTGHMQPPVLSDIPGGMSDDICWVSADAKHLCFCRKNVAVWIQIDAVSGSNTTTELKQLAQTIVAIIDAEQVVTDFSLVECPTLA